MTCDPGGALCARRGLGSARLASANRVAAAVLFAALFAGCGGDDGGEEVPDELRLGLESLAFVPRGRTDRFAQIQVGSDVDLLVDRFEVTRRQWRLAGLSEPPAWADDAWLPASEDLPATYLFADEIEAFLERRGMRLLTVEEWLWCAVGPRASAFPYGRPQEAVANTKELELGRPTPVGTFEGGRTRSTGLYDLHGNVHEVVEINAPYPLQVQTATALMPHEWWGPILRASVAEFVGWPGRRLLEPLVPRAWHRLAPVFRVAGGSFQSPARPTFNRFGSSGILVEGLAEIDHRNDIGFRAAADARIWLQRHAAAFSRANLRPFVEAVGERWGPPAVPLLEQLAREDDAPDAIRWLLEGAK